MMSNTKVPVLLITILLLFFSYGCKKKGSAAETDSPESPAVPAKPENPASEVKTYAPISLATSDSKIELKYIVNSNLVSEIKYSNGRRETMDYNDKKLPKEYRRYSKDELVYKVYYITDQDGLVINGIQYQVESNGKLLTLLGNYQISYNEAKQIAAISWYNFKNTLTANQQFSYDEKSYLAAKRTQGSNSFTQRYSYDGKPGLFKHIPFTQVLAIENEDFYWLNDRSNLSSLTDENTPAANKNVTSEYHVDGYPTAFIVVDAKNQKKEFKISYR